MLVLTNIPFAIINNIGFAAILFLVYQVLKSLQEKEILSIKAAYLFSMASIFQGLGLVQFIALLFYPKLGSAIITTGLDFFTAGINSLFMQAPIGWLTFIGFLYCIILVGLIIKTGFQFYQDGVLVMQAPDLWFVRDTNNDGKADKQTVFADKLCIECDACVDICPMDCITFTDNGEEKDLRLRLVAPAMNPTQDLYIGSDLKTGRVMVKDEDVCLHCGLCAERCPTGAWDMRKYYIEMTHAEHACRKQ